MTMNDTWGYKTYDNNFKSTETLIRNLIDIASKGGNYLLNIGPDSHGIVPAARGRAPAADGQVAGRQRRSHLRHPAHPLRCRGRHLQPTEKDKNGNPNSFPPGTGAPPPRPDKIYIEIFAWPANGAFHLDKLPRKVTGAYLLADKAHKPLKLTHTGEGLDIHLPAKAFDPIATVLVLNTAN